MATEGAELNFSTNIGTVVAEITRALQEAQRSLEAAGRAGDAAVIGPQFTQGLASAAAEATGLAGAIEEAVTKVRDGMGSLSDLKGNTTLGGQFKPIIEDLVSGLRTYVSTLDEASRAQLGGDARLRESVVAPVQERINQLRQLEATLREYAASSGDASVGRFLNSGQITRAAGVGQQFVDEFTARDARGGYANPLPAYNPTAPAYAELAADRFLNGGRNSASGADTAWKLGASDDALLKAQQKRIDSLNQSSREEAEVEQASRDLAVHIAQMLAEGRGRLFGNVAQIDEPDPNSPIGTTRRAYQLLGNEYGQAPELGATSEQAAEAARVVAEEQAALANEREQARVDRQALTDAQTAVGTRQAPAVQADRLLAGQALWDSFQNGDPGFSRIANSSFFRTPQGTANLKPYGLDTQLNAKEQQAALDAVAKEGKATADELTRLRVQAQSAREASDRLTRQEDAYANILASSPRLKNVETTNPGYRDLGPYLQSYDQLLKANGDVLTSAQDEYRARRALAEKLNQEARGTSPGGGRGSAGGGSIFDSFLGGAFGHGFDTHAQFDPSAALGNLAATAGVLARYGYEFKLIQGALDGVKKSFEEFAAYQTNMIELDSVIKATGADSLDLNQAFGLAAQSNVTANEAYQIGAQALEAYRSEIEKGADANTIFAQSVEAVGISVSQTGLSQQQAQKYLVASTNGFQLGSSGQGRINDAVFNATRNYGGSQGEILQAVSTSGSAAQIAGISPEELANIAALIQSHTGDSGAGIGGTIDRLVSRQSNQQFRGALGRLGIEDTGNLSSEIKQMSASFNGLTKAEQDAFLQGLGGSRNLKDLLPLIEYGTTLTDANARSYAGAGNAANEYQRQLNSVSGQLKQVHTLLVDIGTNVGRAGIFDGFGVAVKTLVPALQGVNTLLTAFNTLLHAIPGGSPIFGIVVDVLLLAKAMDVMREKFAATSASKAADNRTTQEAGKFQEQYNEILARGNVLKEQAVKAAEERTLALEGENAQLELQARLQAEVDVARAGALIPGAGTDLRSAAGVASAEAGPTALARAGGGLAAFATSPVTWAIAGLIAIGGTKTAMDKFNSAATDSTKALQDLADAKTADQFKGAASSLNQAAEKAARSSGGIFGSIINEGRANTLRRADQQQAKYANDEAARITEQQQGQAGDLASTVFAGGATSLAAGLQTMKDQGIDAYTQLKAVSEALGLVKTNAGGAAASLANLGIGVGGHQVPTGPTGSEVNVAQLAAGLKGINVPFNYDGLTSTPRGSVNDHYKVGKDFTKATPIIRDTLSHLGVGQDDPITEQDLGAVADALVQHDIDSSPGNQLKHMTTQAKAALRTAYLNSLRKSLTTLSAQQIASETGGLDDQGLQSALAALLPAQQQALQQTNPKLPAIAGFGKDGSTRANTGTQLDVLQQSVDQLNQLKDRATNQSGTAYTNLLQEIDKAENNLAEAKIAGIEAIRQAAEANAGSLSKIKSIRADYFEKEIKAAGDSETAMISVLDQMTQGEINLVLKYYEGQQKIKQAAVTKAKQAFDTIHRAAEHDPDLRSEAAQAESLLNQAIAALGGATSTVDTIKSSVKSGTVTPSTTADSATQALQQTDLARIAAGADPRNPISQAQTALAVANKQVQDALANSGGKKNADYWNAIKAVADAKYQLAQAQTAQSQAETQAKVFPGSQIQAAAAEITNARRELKDAEKGTSAWWKAWGDYQKGLVDAANAQLENAHNQRLLKLDVTNPVALANEQVKQDKDKLASDKKLGAPVDVLNADKVKLKQDNASAVDAAFNQKMTDEKNLFDLQQLSASQYLSFLESQRAALMNVKNKTRQQYDELVSVDQAIKGVADQMNGQWNIGQIRIPTPYEARRSIQATSQGAGYQSTAVSTNSTQIVINGTDIGLVQKLLWQILGPSATARTTTAARKA